MTNRLVLIFLLSLIFHLGCNEVEDSLPLTDLGEASGDYPNGIYVVNEGNFDWGYGTVTHFNPETKQVSESVFKQKNGFELGNVAQSMLLHNGKGYIVINNSARIEVVNPYNMEWQGRINIPKSSPRYLLPLSSKKGYVTDLYADHFYVLDLAADSLIKTVPTSGWTEKMVRVNNHVYMTQTRTVFDSRREGGQLLLKIDGTTDQVVDSLALPNGPIDIQVDALNQVWVLCFGDLIGATPALVQVDPETMTIRKNMSFSNEAASNPSRLRIDGSGTVLYYLNGGVFKHEIDTDKLEENPIIPENGRLFYGLGYNPHDRRIYVTDAIDYVQKGWVFRYEENGAKVDSFKVGVIPNELLFY
ncbi:DUF5074 domain-containing protein [Limibacter armeniacum]|uniref:DUF5074 domain-containing protein n=1 Tax=Limibacter armeniacum TaxID=466084 RepID=UPI002FE53550